MENPTHLGDGVYAKWDGFQVAISVNDHRNEPVVFMEPSVIENLVTWIESISKTQPKT